LLTFPPSIWWAAVAVPHRNPSGKRVSAMGGDGTRGGVREDDGMSQDAVDALVTLLDLEPIEVNIFRGLSPDEERQRVFGGQVAGQALVAAARTVEPGRLVHSLHAYFLRPGDPTVPILYEVDRIRDGRSFTTRRVVAIQHGKAIFNLQCSFQVTEEGLEHEAPMPDVASPDELPDFQTRMAPYAAEMGPWYNRPRPIDTRHVDWNPPDRREPRPPYQRVWLRADGTLPDDPVLHACVLTYASDMTVLDTALLPHGGAWGDEGLFMASLDHAMWFHRPFRADEWMLYDQDTPSASAGRGLGRGSIFSEEGHLAVTVVQEGLIRVVKG
jgi:acyl-CoA thioesterase II